MFYLDCTRLGAWRMGGNRDNTRHAHPVILLLILILLLIVFLILIFILILIRLGGACSIASREQE
jgi:hypothetical protein